MIAVNTIVLVSVIALTDVCFYTWKFCGIKLTSARTI